MQQVEPLCRQLTGEKVDPRQVTARPSEADDKTEPDRVLGGNKGDRDRRGCRLGSGRRGGRARGDYSDLSANQFGRQLRQSIVLVLGEAIDDCYVLALHIADLFEALAKCAQTVRHRVGRSGVEQPNHRHRRLLRARRERPCDCRAAEQRDELAAFHSITLMSCRLPSSSGESKLIPVMLPPGRASEVTSPSATMSSLAPTSGMVRVAACSARKGSSAPATITSGAALTMAAASSARCSLPASNPSRFTVRFCPSIKPLSRSSSNNASVAGVWLEEGIRKPSR